MIRYGSEPVELWSMRHRNSRHTYKWMTVHCSDVPYEHGSIGTVSHFDAATNIVIYDENTRHWHELPLNLAVMERIDVMSKRIVVAVRQPNYQIMFHTKRLVYEKWDIDNTGTITKRSAPMSLDDALKLAQNPKEQAVLRNLFKESSQA